MSSLFECMFSCLTKDTLVLGVLLGEKKRDTLLRCNALGTSNASGLDLFEREKRGEDPENSLSERAQRLGRSQDSLQREERRRSERNSERKVVRKGSLLRRTSSSKFPTDSTSLLDVEVDRLTFKAIPWISSAGRSSPRLKAAWR